MLSKAFAAGSSSFATSPGNRLRLAGKKIAVRAEATATSVKRTGRGGKVNAIAAKIPACPRSQAIMTNLRSTRSANAPAIGPRTRGRDMANKTPATAGPEPRDSLT